MQLPNDAKTREALSKAIEEIVDVLIAIDDQKSFIKDVCDRMKEDHKIKPAELRKRAKIRYKQKVNEILYAIEKEQADALYAENEILFNDEQDDE